jgi:hypothetical protein
MERKYRGPGRYSQGLRDSDKANVKPASVDFASTLLSSEVDFGPWREPTPGERVDPNHVAIYNGEPRVPCRIYKDKPPTPLFSSQLILSESSR